MEIRQFNYIKMVADCGSITKAARRLFISQPSLSNYISRVEEELGVLLFERSASPLVLTYAGEQYLKHAGAVLLEMDNMEKKMRDISSHFKGRLRVGCPNERGIYMLPLILPEFKKHYPGIEVEIMSAAGNRLVEALRRGDIDFCFLPMWEEQKDLSQVKIVDEELFLITAESYLDDSWLLDAKNRVFDWNRISELPLIMLRKGHMSRKSVDVLLKNKNIKANVVMEIHSNMLAYRLAAQGMGVAVVPEITLRLLEKTVPVEYYHLSGHPVSWEVFAVCRKGSYIGEVERTFWNIAVDVFHNPRRSQPVTV